jgi:hypothetical protein
MARASESNRAAADRSDARLNSPVGDLNGGQRRCGRQPVWVIYASRADLWLIQHAARANPQ